MGSVVLKRAFAIVVATYCCLSYGQAALLAPDAELAESAMRSELRGLSSTARGARVAESRRLVESAARSRALRETEAVVLLRRGLTIEELTTLLERHSLAPVRLEAKLRVAADGSTHTFSLTDFHKLPGTLAERLRMSAGHAPAMHMMRLGRAEGAARTRDMEIARANLKFYKVTVVGSWRSLATVLRHSSIRGVLPAADEQSAAAFRAFDRDMDFDRFSG